MFLLRLLFAALPQIKKRSRSVMTHGQTRYNSSNSLRNAYVIIFLLLVAILVGTSWVWREYYAIDKREESTLRELAAMKYHIANSPKLTDLVSQNAALLDQNKTLVNENIQLRRQTRDQSELIEDLHYQIDKLKQRK